MVPDTGNAWWIILGVIAIIFVVVIMGIVKLAKAKKTKRAPKSTPVPTLLGYDGTRATIDPLNPFLSASLSGQHRSSSSTQGETVPLSTDFEHVVIEIPPPSYQDHKKDMEIPNRI
ncbi:unnamed protein product [Umbelopsis ramanniana]